MTPFDQKVIEKLVRNEFDRNTMSYQFGNRIKLINTSKRIGLSKAFIEELESDNQV